MVTEATLGAVHYWYMSLVGGHKVRTPIPLHVGALILIGKLYASAPSTRYFQTPCTRKPNVLR